MTQEDKDLLLKDICARLPYHTNLYSEYADDNWAILTPVVYAHTANCSPDEIGIKPYLFPLSSMTVEQRCKVQNLLPNNCEISFKNQKITFYDEGNVQLEQLEKIFHFFNLYHFDYRGLIEKGLAIDATGLNIY